LFIAFFYLLNHDNMDAGVHLEKDTPTADPQPIPGFVILQGRDAPAVWPIGKVKNGISDCGKCFPVL